MKRFTKDEFKALFKSIDLHLEKDAEIILIGGAAALLAYKASQITRDIDSFNKISGLRIAYKRAVNETGLEIPLSTAGVADAPYNFEDRLKLYRGLKLKRLQIRIPEVHDLILMKTIRGYEHDLEVIQEICEKNRISKKTLIVRYESEMGHVMGHERTRFVVSLVFARKGFLQAGETAACKSFVVIFFPDDADTS